MAREPKNTEAAATGAGIAPPAPPAPPAGSAPLVDAATGVPLGETATSAEALLSGAAAQEASGRVEPLKERPGDLGRGRELVQERADVSRDRTGEPTSAEVKAEPVPTTADLHRGEIRRAYADTRHFAGTLPARKRILVGGEAVTIETRTDTGEQREFTTTVRTLRNKIIYEIGADIPLSRNEFETKRAAGAVLEQSWPEGRTEFD